MTNDELLAGCRRLPSGHYQNPELTEDDRLALLGFKNLNERGARPGGIGGNACRPAPDNDGNASARLYDDPFEKFDADVAAWEAARGK